MMSISTKSGHERRQHRRHDLTGQSLTIERWDDHRRHTNELGYIVDVSASGVRLRTEQPVKADSQIRVRVEMPSFAGISPFVDTRHAQPRPRNEWIGWLSVCRVTKVTEGQYEAAGRLVDMDDMDRGMLGLYLSTQPLAA
jgi:hypothetical protein